MAVLPEETQPKVTDGFGGKIGDPCTHCPKLYAAMYYNTHPLRLKHGAVERREYLRAAETFLRQLKLNYYGQSEIKNRGISYNENDVIMTPIGFSNQTDFRPAWGKIYIQTKITPLYALGIFSHDGVDVIDKNEVDPKIYGYHPDTREGHDSDDPREHHPVLSNIDTTVINSLPSVKTISKKSFLWLGSCRAALGGNENIAKAFYKAQPLDAVFGNKFYANFSTEWRIVTEVKSKSATVYLRAYAFSGKNLEHYKLDTIRQLLIGPYINTIAFEETKYGS